MIITIPVKPYVKHLLIEHYGKDPIAVRANSDLGQIFMLSVWNSVFLNVTFGWKGQNVPGLEDELKDWIADELGECGKDELDMPEGLVELRFKLGGKFKRGLLLPDVMLQLGKSLESYVRIYMKGFSHGYRCLFNSGRSSAVVFHGLFGFPEEVLSRDNAEKIVQRENAEMKDPIDAPRKSLRISKKA